MTNKIAHVSEVICGGFVTRSKSVLRFLQGFCVFAGSENKQHDTTGYKTFCEIALKYEHIKSEN